MADPEGTSPLTPEEWAMAVAPYADEGESAQIPIEVDGRTITVTERHPGEFERGPDGNVTEECRAAIERGFNERITRVST